MHRCFIEFETLNESLIVPSESEAHHLLHVLRAEEGDAVAVFDGSGIEADAVVHINDQNGLELIVQGVKAASKRAFSLTLIIAIPKGSRSDLIIEKATELGIARIIPVMSDRVIVRLEGKQADKRVDRWERVAKSAAKQCGTKWLPQIDPVQTFDKVLGGLSQFDAVLLGSLATGVKPLKDAVQEQQKQELKSVAVIIGPEGDLTPAEIELSLKAGAVPVSFGDLTLRTETAAIFALSVLSYEFMW
jgi:16S rRNA (uracil1498-N3)-methyltransferase